MTAQDQHLANVFQQPPIIAYRRQRNLKDILIKSKVPPQISRYPHREVKGMSKCGKMCTACPFITTGSEVKIDKEGKKLHLIDQGVGMTSDEVQKYINEVAFSGAEEFLDKYKDKVEDAGIIGHFGLGFYSAFMVAEKVEIITKSYKNEPAAHWLCDGSPEYSLEKSDKKERGTEIILHIAEDSTEFLEEKRITELLNKYNKFMRNAKTMDDAKRCRLTFEGYLKACNVLERERKRESKEEVQEAPFLTGVGSL